MQELHILVRESSKIYSSIQEDTESRIVAHPLASVGNYNWVIIILVTNDNSAQNRPFDVTLDDQLMQ